MKIESIMTRSKQKDLQNEVIHTLKIAGLMSNQRSYADLIYSCKQVIPQYFGFEAANILLRDVKTGLLFTVNELYYHDK